MKNNGFLAALRHQLQLHYADPSSAVVAAANEPGVVETADQLRLSPNAPHDGFTTRPTMGLAEPVSAPDIINRIFLTVGGTAAVDGEANAMWIDMDGLLPWIEGAGVAQHAHAINSTPVVVIGGTPVDLSTDEARACLGKAADARRHLERVSERLDGLMPLVYIEVPGGGYAVRPDAALDDVAAAHRLQREREQAERALSKAIEALASFRHTGRTVAAPADFRVFAHRESDTPRTSPQAFAAHALTAMLARVASERAAQAEEGDASFSKASEDMLDSMRSRMRRRAEDSEGTDDALHGVGRESRTSSAALAAALRRAALHDPSAHHRGASAPESAPVRPQPVDLARHATKQKPAQPKRGSYHRPLIAPKLPSGRTDWSKVPENACVVTLIDDNGGPMHGRPVKVRHLGGGVIRVAGKDDPEERAFSGS